MDATQLRTAVLASKALDFLNDHPGIHLSPMGGFMADCSFHMSPVSAEGIDMLSPIIVGRSDPRFKEFLHLVDADEMTDPEAEALVQYKDYYGKPWEAAGVEYWCEVDFFAFVGQTLSQTDDYDFRNWSRYHGFDHKDESMEWMLIRAASKVAELFGNFNTQCFLSAEEKENHSKESVFLHPPHTHMGPWSLEHNPEYMHVSDGMINRRWLKWFWNTKWCRENWANDAGLKELAEDEKIPDVKPLELPTVQAN